MATYIWRVEKDGTGPFNVDKPEWEHIKRAIQDPAPETGKAPDDMPYIKTGVPMPGEIFGFNTPQDFDEWFPPSVRDVLHRHGYIGAIYEVQKPFVRDDIQTLASRMRAKPILNFTLNQEPVPEAYLHVT